MQKQNNIKTAFIYTLNHPITGEIRYVGKTVKKLNDRLKNHIWESKQLACYRHKWIDKLTKYDLKPEIKILDIVPKEEWQFWESYWIEQMNVWGFNLTNSTPGGDGFDWTGRVHKQESKDKMSKAKKNKPSWNKGKNLTDEHKMKLSKSHFGKKLSKESIEKRSLKIRKPVAIVDKFGNILEVFAGTVEARNKTGVDCVQIKKLIKNNGVSKRGYIFKYI